MEYIKLPLKVIRGFIFCSSDSKLSFFLSYFFILYFKSDLFYSFEGKIIAFA